MTDIPDMHPVRELQEHIFGDLNSFVMAVQELSIADTADPKHTFRAHLARHQQIPAILARLNYDPCAWEAEDITILARFIHDLESMFRQLQAGAKYDSKLEREERRKQALQIKAMIDRMQNISMQFMRLHALELYEIVVFSVHQSKVMTEMLESIKPQAPDYTESLVQQEQYQRQLATYEANIRSAQALAELQYAPSVARLKEALLSLARHAGKDPASANTILDDLSERAYVFGNFQQLPLIRMDGSAASVEEEVRSFIALHKSCLNSMARV
jgi:hypothetical protein